MRIIRFVLSWPIILIAYLLFILARFVSGKDLAFGSEIFE